MLRLQGASEFAVTEIYIYIYIYIGSETGLYQGDVKERVLFGFQLGPKRIF